MESHMRYHWVAARRRTPANAIARCHANFSRVRHAVRATRAPHGIGKDEEVGGVPDSSDGPTVLRILLGSHLRRLREARGITARQAATKIRASESKISRIELGRNAIREIDVLDLLTLYGVDAREREQLLTLAEQSNKPGWWHRYNDILPDWFQAYVGMEEAARSIRVYEAQFVPGLLQTEEYARAVILQGAPGLDPDEVERRVALRMGRQKLLTREAPPRYWVIMDEAALRRPMGGRDVHVGQIERLIDLVGEPNITIQVMPFRYGGHAAESGAFTIMRFPETDLPDVVYMEYLTGAHYIDKPEEVERYAAVMVRVSVAATSPDQTREILTGMLRQD
jgi:transcriptional regulator with XRE-family HTH domain